MFTKKITDADAFIELSSAAQALYFHLNQGADDDGFNNQVQMAMFKAHASVDDLKVLLAKNYIIRFESGVVVIKHWRMHNLLRKDRYTDTNFQEELALLDIKDNGAYTLKDDLVAKWLPNGCQTVAKRLPQESKGEKSIREGSEGEEERADAHVHAKAETKHFHGAYNNVKLTDKELDSLYATYGKEEVDEAIDYLSEYIKMKGYKAQSHYLALRKWVFDALKEDRIKKAELEAREKRVQPHTDTHSTFDSDEFLNAAVNRTFGEERF
jgi:hypothetical protein